MQALTLAGPGRSCGSAHSPPLSVPPYSHLGHQKVGPLVWSTCLCRGHIAVMRGHGSVLLTALVCSVFCLRGRGICSFWLLGAAEGAEGPQAGRGVQGWSHFKIIHPNALYSSDLPLRAVHYIRYFSIAKKQC